MDDDFFFKVLDKEISNAETKKNYTSRLNGLLANIKAFYDTSKQRPTSRMILHILTHPTKYAPIIEKIYNNSLLTTKNIFTLVLSLYKHANLACDYPNAHDKWAKVHEEYTKKEKIKYSKNEQQSH